MANLAADTLNFPLSTTSPTKVSLSGTTARNSTALTAGHYRITATVDCYIVQGGSTIEADTDEYLLPAGAEIHRVVDSASSAYFAAITDGGTGSLFIQVWN